MSSARTFKSEPRALHITPQKRKAYELASGREPISYAQIAEHFGVTKGTVTRWVAEVREADRCQP